MKQLFIAVCTLLLATGVKSVAQTTAAQQMVETSQYLVGAVPEEHGQVVFTQTYNVPGKSKAELFNALKAYTESVVKGENRLPQARITELSPEDGVIAASMEETLWFKRSALVSDFARFYYQLVFEVSDASFKVTLRRLRYIYEPMATPGQDNVLLAEDWITDKEALKKNGTKLRRGTSKKFRIATINRKNELFRGAAKACGLKVVRVIEE